MTGEERLKLIARDPTDLTVMSACLQDGLVPVSDIAWLQDDGQFALAVNRFKWEQAEEESEGVVFYRTHALVRIDGVKTVRSKGFDRRDRTRILSLLSVRPVEGGVDLLFADGVAVRVEADPLTVTLVDMGFPWPTRWRPDHPDA